VAVSYHRVIEKAAALDDKVIFLFLKTIFLENARIIVAIMAVNKKTQIIKFKINSAFHPSGVGK